jgi:glycosyltransferase involved in cell wall biosynthesis
VIHEGRNGFLVPVNNAAALVEGIARVVGDPALAATLAAQARVIACEQFDERLIFARVQAAYIGLLEQKGFNPAARGLSVGAAQA